MNAQFYIDQLQLQPHPEGGFYKETYRAAENIARDALPLRFSSSHSFSTIIYYLLQKRDFSAFHRITSDEGWHFYAGQTLLIHIIDNDGKYQCLKLGSDIAAGESFQLVVPATSWFAVEPDVNSEFALVGCTVAPGFNFEDFEMADKESMWSAYPSCRNIITRLCR